MNRRHLLAGAMVILVVLGTLRCARKPGAVVSREVGPEYLVGKIEANRHGLRSLSAELKVRITQEKQRTIDAWLIYQGPDQYRLEVWGPLGSSLMALRIDGNQFVAYFPSTNEVAEGPFHSLPQLFDVDVESPFLASAISGVPDLDRSWLIHLADFQIRGDEYFLEFKRSGRVRRAWIDPRTLMVDREEWDATVVVRYRGYRRISDIWRPKEVVIARSTDHQKVRVRFVHQEINAPISPEDFRLRFPRGATRIVVE